MRVDSLYSKTILSYLVILSISLNIIREK